MGEMTHRALSMYLFALKKHIIDGWPEPDQEKIATTVKKIMEEAFELSKSNNFDGYIKFGLSEHFYQEMPEDWLEQTYQKVMGNLEAFINSEYHNKIEQRFRKWHHIYIESPHRPNFEMMKVDVSSIPWLENISILACPDFWIMFWEKDYIILDWKSGKEKKEVLGITDQLRVYALKTLLKQKTKELWDRNIDVHEIYLPSLNEKSGKIEQKDIEYIINKILEDVEYQKQFIVDQDVARNEPLSHNIFSRTDNEKKCEWCTYRSVCKKLKENE